MTTVFEVSNPEMLEAVVPLKDAREVVHSLNALADTVCRDAIGTEQREYIGGVAVPGPLVKSLLAEAGGKPEELLHYFSEIDALAENLATVVSKLKAASNVNKKLADGLRELQALRERTPAT